MNKCPKCGAPLQETAVFCPHCMTQFGEKQTMEKPKIPNNKNKKALLVSIAAILILSIIGSVTCGILYKKHSPICTYEQFTAAAPIVSEKMGLNELWDVNSFTDIRYLEEQKIMQYSTDVNIENAFLSVFFYNKGEQVLSYICDVSPEDYSDAESLIKCIVQSSCNYYFTDIDKVFDDENVYPKTVMSVPFDSFYTDLVSRTARYNEDIKNGTKITTNYIEMQSEDLEVVYFVTERNDGGSIVYDLSLNIMRTKNAV